jgi:hypothetical protein
MYSQKRLKALFCGSLLAGALLFMPGTPFAQVRVTHITAREGTAGRKGIIYALPRTVLLIDLQVTRTDKIPGPYAPYAQELLGLTDVITARQTSYGIDRAAIIPAGEPDPEQVYLVEKDEKASEDIFYAFDRSGLLISSEGIPEESGIQGEGWNDYFSRVITEEEAFPGYSAGAMKENTDTITRIVTLDTIVYTEKILKRSMVRQSDKDKAMEAASMINSIGQDQYTLLVGYQETAYSAEALKFMTGQLETQRKNYLQLFTGISRKEQIHISLVYLPPSAIAQEGTAIAGFSPLIGLAEADGTNDITITLAKKGLTEVLGTDPVSTGYAAGYYYRIPETCEVTIKYKGETIGKKVLPVNQAGVIRSLPPTVTQVEFYPESGSLKKVVLK